MLPRRRLCWQDAGFRFSRNGRSTWRNLIRRRRKPVALFIDETHNLHPKTLTGLKRLMEVVADGGGRLSIVLAGHPKLRNNLRRPTMEEIGYRTSTFAFDGIIGQQREYMGACKTMGFVPAWIGFRLT